MRAWGSWDGDVVRSDTVWKMWGARQPQGAATSPPALHAFAARPSAPGPVTYATIPRDSAAP